MHMHVGFYQWNRNDGVSLWVCSARDNDGQRWVERRAADVAGRRDGGIATTILNPALPARLHREGH